MIKRKHVILFVFCLSVTSLTEAQLIYSGIIERRNIIYGDEAFADGDYYSASMFYKKALLNDSIDVNKLELSYKYADACRLYFNYRDAASAYAEVLKKDVNNEYPLSLFWLAMMNKSYGDYKEAGKSFKKYYETHIKEDNYFTRKSLHEIDACEFAVKLIKDTLPIEIKHLDNNVNTPYSEFNALQLSDSILLFSSLRSLETDSVESFIPKNIYFHSKIYESESSVTGWAASEELKMAINDKKSHNANISISSDHKNCYFSRCNTDKFYKLHCAIYKSEFKEGKWQEPVKLEEKINLPYHTSTQPSIVKLDNEKEVLYFVSDRPGGYGNLDIWYTVINNGEFGKPVNLGEIINTSGDEITPFYYSPTQTLYFSSDWHNGLGGYDVFKSKGNLKDWSNPQNIGFPVNTSYNDLYFSVNELDSNGYLSSNRPGSYFLKGETCCYDIYKYEWEKPVADTSIEVEIRQLVGLTLYFHNDEPDPKTTKTSTEKNYKETLEDYFKLKNKYKREYSKGLKGIEEQKAEQDIEDFFNDYVGKGFADLEKFTSFLLKDLQRGSDVKITIKGYCSPLNTTEYNVYLAQRRISSLINYFKEYENGIFLKYLNGTSSDGGKLTILEEPLGESQANPFVSDNRNDKRNSIYSRAASFERKIKIIMYRTDDFTAEPEIK